MVGFVRDCADFPRVNPAPLCGRRGAYLRGHYLYVAATQVDAVTVVDLYRPDMPTVAGSVSDPVRLKGVVQTWAHRSRRARRRRLSRSTTRRASATRRARRRANPRVVPGPVPPISRQTESGKRSARLRARGGRVRAFRRSPVRLSGVYVVGDVAHVASEMSNALATGGASAHPLAGFPGHRTGDDYADVHRFCGGRAVRGGVRRGGGRDDARRVRRVAVVSLMRRPRRRAR